MSINLGRIKDQSWIWEDRISPREGIETKVVAGSAITFAHPITGGVPYAIFSETNAVYFTLNGSSPAVADAVGAAGIGIPVPAGRERLFMLEPDTSATLKCIASGSNRAQVSLYRLSISSSF